MNRLVPLLCAAVALTACGSDGAEDGPFAGALSRAQPTEISDRFVALLRAEAPALQYGLVARQEGGTLLMERQEGDITYWLTPDAAQFVLEDGVLVATRGFGTGLLASDVKETAAAVRSVREDHVMRLQTYLTGNDLAVTRTFLCDITNEGAAEVELPGGLRQSTRLRESCNGLGDAFENLYWVNDRGDILVSRQWAGPFLGFMSTRALR